MRGRCQVMCKGKGDMPAITEGRRDAEGKRIGKEEEG